MAQQSSHPWRRPLAAIRRCIEGLGPYPSLFVLAIPTSLIEPLKLAAVAIADQGHWIAGTIVIACAYAASLLVVERLFRIVKPKLLKLPWFARLWNWFVTIRYRALGWLRSARDLLLYRT
jgi:hypothetical protein